MVQLLVSWYSKAWCLPVHNIFFVGSFYQHNYGFRLSNTVFQIFSSSQIASMIQANLGAYTVPQEYFTIYASIFHKLTTFIHPLFGLVYSANKELQYENLSHRIKNTTHIDTAWSFIKWLTKDWNSAKKKKKRGA